DHVWVVDWSRGMELLSVLGLAAHLLRVDRHFADVARVDISEKLREGDFRLFLARAAGPYHLPKENGRYHDDQPENNRLYRRIHSRLLDETNHDHANRSGPWLF